MMANKEFFPKRPASHPMIYAYSGSNPQYKGLLKVGYTEKDVEKRVAQHNVLDLSQEYPTKRPDGLAPYKIAQAESAMRHDDICYTNPGIRHIPHPKRLNGVSNG